VGYKLDSWMGRQAVAHCVSFDLKGRAPRDVRIVSEA
jgi:hypothetical protein